MWMWHEEYGMSDRKRTPTVQPSPGMDTCICTNADRIKRRVSGRSASHVAATQAGAREAVKALIKTVCRRKSEGELGTMSPNEVIIDVSNATLELDHFDEVGGARGENAGSNCGRHEIV